MKPLTFISKHAGGSKYRNYLIVLCCVLCAVIIESCHCPKCQNPTEKLHILYLNNTATAPELKQLLDSAHYRISFEFVHDTAGVLTLSAWPTKDTLGNYSKYSSKILHVTTQEDSSLIGHEVNLGNIQLDKIQRNLLLADTNKSGFQFILFYPRIEKDTLAGENNVVYDIYSSPTLPSAPHPLPPPPPAAKIATAANPSPPYKTY